MRSSPKPTSVASSSSAAAITSSRSRATSRRWKPTSPWPSGRIPPSAAWTPAPDVDRVETVEKGHGRIEIRRLECSESLASYLRQWPGLRQVCRIERRRSLRGKDSIEVVHAITSLSRERADAASLLTIARGHWGIENRLHHVRDRTCREDACRTRSGNAPQTLAPLRHRPPAPPPLAKRRPPHPATPGGPSRRGPGALRRTSLQGARRPQTNENRMTLARPARLGIWMNGWEGLFLAVRRMGCFRAGCEFGTEPAHAPQPRHRPHPCDRHRRDPSRRGPAARPPAPAPERVRRPRRCPRALARALPPP